MYAPSVQRTPIAPPPTPSPYGTPAAGLMGVPAGIRALARMAAAAIGDDPEPFIPSEWPDYIITDGTGHAVNPDDLMVTRDQNGDRRVVAKLTATAPSQLVVSKPDVITWQEEPGTGGLVLRKLENGVSTMEARPWKPFDQMSPAEVLAYWTAVSPGDEGGWADYSKADGTANLTDTGKAAIAILQHAGATAAAKAAAAVAGTTVDQVTSTTTAQYTPPAGPPPPQVINTTYVAPGVDPNTVHTATMTPSPSSAQQPVLTFLPTTSTTGSDIPGASSTAATALDQLKSLATPRNLAIGAGVVLVGVLATRGHRQESLAAQRRRRR